VPLSGLSEIRSVRPPTGCVSDESQIAARPSERTRNQPRFGSLQTKEATSQDLSEKAESIQAADGENIPKKTEDLTIRRAMDEANQRQADDTANPE
jgi:hypothetical protein